MQLLARWWGPLQKQSFKIVLNSDCIIGMSCIYSQLTSLNGTTHLKCKFWYVYLTISLITLWLYSAYSLLKYPNLLNSIVLWESKEWLRRATMEECLLEVNCVFCSGHCLYFISFNSHIIPAEGYFTDKKTKAQAKSVWLIQVTFTSLSNSYNNFMVYPVPDSSLALFN